MNRKVILSLVIFVLAFAIGVATVSASPKFRVSLAVSHGRLMAGEPVHFVVTANEPLDFCAVQVESVEPRSDSTTNVIITGCNTAYTYPLAGKYVVYAAGVSSAGVDSTNGRLIRIH